MTAPRHVGRQQWVPDKGQDPVLRRVKLIAEPWDVSMGGYLVGQMPPPWVEWNDQYRDEIRGFSLDFESVAPGPLLRTTGEVIAALGDTDAVRSEFADRYAAFMDAYCGLADGEASARVVDRVFEL